MRSLTKISIPLILAGIVFLSVSSFSKAKYEPPDGKVYHGVGWYTSAQSNYITLFPENNRPLLVQHVISMPGSRGISAAKILAAFNQDHISPDSQYMEMSAHFSDEKSVLDSVFAFTSDIDSCIDSIAKAFSEHVKPVFFRIGLEMNGAWNGYTPWIFPQAFRKLVEALRARTVKNFATVWCYEPDAPADFADSTAQGWKWYPGDDVVDWFSLDPFDADHFDPSLPDSSGGVVTKKGKSELFLKFAQARGKPVYLNETTCRKTFITPDSLDIDSADGIHDWQYWFEPWFAFLDIHPVIKAFNYINLDWTQFDKWKHWGDARIEINSYIRNRWVQKLSEEKFLHAGYIIDEQSGVKFNANPKAIDPSILICSYAKKVIVSFPTQTVQPVIVELYTIQGKLVERVVTKNSRQSVALPTDHLSAGVYTVTAGFGNRVVSRKYVIAR